MAGKKRTTAMQEAWIKAQKDKQRAAKKAKADKDRKDGAALRSKYKSKKKSK